MGISTRRWGTVALAVAIAAFAVACAARPVAPPPPQVDVFEKSDYVIGASDHLVISVWQNPELRVEAPVRPDGKISVPLIDDVHAEGLTALELKELLTQAYAEYINNPDVSVLVKTVLSKRAYVVGGVPRNGPVLLQSDTRVLDAISVAGGFTTFADKKRVKIIRKNGDDEIEYRFDYEAYIVGRAPGSNIRLRPGDTIVVPD